MSFVLDLHDYSSIVELFAVRRILEPAAVSLAAVRMSDAAVADLRGQVGSVGKSTSVDGLVAHDLEFHGAIVSAAGNSYLASLNRLALQPHSQSAHLALTDTGALGPSHARRA